MINIGSKSGKLKWVLPLAVAAFAVPASLALFPESAVSTALAQSSDTLKRLMDRSPGVRGETAPLKGKGKATAMGVGEKLPPAQRALGKVFDSVPEEAIEELALGPVVPQSAPGGATPIDEIGNVPPPPRTGSSSGGFIIPIGGSSSGSSSGGSTGEISSSSGGTSTGGSTTGGSTSGGTSGGSTSGGVTPPVPEPGTWMMMILGFALIGGVMRRRGKALVGQSRA